MSKQSPLPISNRQQRVREKRIAFIAKKVGFAGHVEYRHVYSQSGGAQFGRGVSEENDLLTVYAEAFERDTDTNDFSLEAIIAHECGHQVLIRHPRIARRMANVGATSEEILASIMGALLCYNVTDRITLLAKATAELLDYGQSVGQAKRQVQELSDLLESLL